jgi:HEPN domain-containing protein
MTPLGREWVRKAEFDRRTALRLQASRPRIHMSICFHCQQFAEKYLKALLHERQQPVPRTHDCRALLGRLSTTEPVLGKLIRSAAALVRMAVDLRYPGYQPSPSESRTAWNAAERIRAEVRRRLGLRPTRDERRKRR